MVFHLQGHTGQPIDGFLLVLVNRITDFFPSAEETSTEKKLCEAFSNCLSGDGNFSATTRQVRDSSLGSSLAVTSAPLQLFSDAAQMSAYLFNLCKSP